ncbi:hypothetical protein INS49_012450 [Diaporthe citri]|uniref:uncharacterized protein n=1 Tax=Diaporthe citri TaxID=83186 RepID=UPI001C81B982|nr:uncharacterized protein INS49_012450 [Diaporthe citri]KAG6358930.1 hypothetical protein INS49_012450 [Diaporthe citri]
MASIPCGPCSRYELPDNSTDTADDTSVEGYELTRQPRPASWSHPDTLALLSPGSLSPGSLEYIDNTEPTPDAPPIDPEPPAVRNRTMTMNIPLDDVDLVQLFLRPDGSVKGISFNYGDSDLADLGCCIAEPGCWYAFLQPRWLLFTPAPGGHRVGGRGFFPVECISFGNVRDLGDGVETNAVRMEGSLVFRLSPDGLEIDMSGDVGVYGTAPRRGKRTFERAARAVKGWLGKHCVLFRLSNKMSRYWKIGQQTR